jgi:hypothetical protein
MRRGTILAGSLALLLAGTPAIAAPSSRELVVDLTPPGGVVFLDGKVAMRNATREVRLSPSAGKHRVRVEFGGFETFEKEVDVAKAGPTNLEVNLVAVKPAIDPALVDFAALPLPTPLPRKVFSSVAVDLPSGEPSTARARAALTHGLAEELQKLDQISRVVEPDELHALAQEKKVRPDLSCNDLENCLTNAAGIDELLTSTFRAEGQDTLLTVNRTDLRTGAVTRAKRTIKGESGEAYAAVIGPVVEELYADHALRAGRTRGSRGEVVASFAMPPPLPRWVFFSTAGAAAATLLTGAAFGLSSLDARSNLRALEARGPGSALSPLALHGSLDRIGARGDQAVILLSVGGGIAVAAAVEAFFTDWHDVRCAPKPLPDSAPVAIHFLPTGVLVSWH